MQLATPAAAYGTSRTSGEQLVEGADDDMALVFQWSAGIGVNIELVGHRVENPSAKESCTSVKAFHSLAARCRARALALRLSRSLVTYSVRGSSTIAESLPVIARACAARSVLLVGCNGFFCAEAS